tara:strand:+ start:204 stop:584 length:381 start_codon:yes stop_codon:yes gene_type:complete
MKQEELQKLLDSLAEGPLGTRKEWQWDNANRQASLKGRKFINRKKRKPVILSEEIKAKWKKQRKNQNPRLGTGAKYIELSTNTTGSASELAVFFNTDSSNIIGSASKDKPKKFGRLKGKHFRKLSN